MKILALNLMDLGPTSKGRRAEKVVNYLRDSAADVLVLSEFKTSLCNAPFTMELEEAGYRYRSISRTDEPRQLGVAVLSHREAVPVPLSPLAVDKQRIAALDIDGITVAGVYFFACDPNLSGTGKFTLFDYLLSVPQELSGPSLVIGDYNTGLHYFDEEGKTFSAESRFKALGKCSWVDLWRAKHGEKREFSFITNRGNPYRIDHTFARGGVEEKVADCYYDHSTRCADESGQRLSNHSAMIVSLDL